MSSGCSARAREHRVSCDLGTPLGHWRRRRKPAKSLDTETETGSWSSVCRWYVVVRNAVVARFSLSTSCAALLWSPCLIYSLLPRLSYPS